MFLRTLGRLVRATPFALASLAYGAQAAAQSAAGNTWPGPGEMVGYGMGSMGWMMLFGGIFWLVLLALAGAAAFAFLRMFQRPIPAPPSMERPSPGLDIIEERYARGEINRDEYLQKKSDILSRNIK